MLTRYLTRADALADGWREAGSMSDLQEGDQVLVQASGALRLGRVDKLGRTRVHVVLRDRHGNDMSVSDYPDCMHVGGSTEERQLEPAVLLDMYVEGWARPQGSKDYIGRGRMREASKHLPAWRAKVVEAARLMRVYPFALGVPVCAHYEFVFERSPSCADIEPITTGIGDNDKLQRAINDAMQIAGIIDNDSQVVSPSGGKRWATPGEKSGVYIRLTEAL